MQPLTLLILTLSCCAGVCGARADNPALADPPALPGNTALRFEISADKRFIPGPVEGRVFVVLGHTIEPEPRTLIGNTGIQAPPVIARDVSGYSSVAPVTLDGSDALFPLRRLGDLPSGEYFVQALLQTNRDLRMPDAPGNFYGRPVKVHLGPAKRGLVKLRLDQKLPGDELPPDGEWVRFIKVRSERLSRFYGHPIYLRAGVILPKGLDGTSRDRYPLRIHIGGFGARYTVVRELMREDSEFRKAWLSDDMPRMVYLLLDGAGPLGDPYQVNSANHGPFGDAITQELIPQVEQQFCCVGRPKARVLSGGSTGGWVALALQIFYPDIFNGAWAGFPDPVDFRSYELIDIYRDENAYVNAAGFERPSARRLNGDVQFTIRHECQIENVLGSGNSYTMSGAQWGSWNATFGPRGADGRPVPLWDPRTGKIDHQTAEYWKRYDLRLILEQNWASLGPRLRGKLRTWVGEADDFFLNEAVHKLEDFLRRADPPAEARIEFGSRNRHGWEPRSEKELMLEMMQAIGTIRGETHGCAGGGG